MHPGLPCFYKKKGEKSQAELVRGSTISLDNGDIFSLHANPDCEFKVMKSDAAGDGDAKESGDDKPVCTVSTDSVCCYCTNFEAISFVFILFVYFCFDYFIILFILFHLAWHLADTFLWLIQV